MSFQSAYGSNNGSFGQKSYELSTNISKSSEKEDQFTDYYKKEFITNLDLFSQGFKKLSDYAEYIDTDRDNIDFRGRLYVKPTSF